MGLLVRCYHHTRTIWGHHHPPSAGRKGSPWPSILDDSGHGRPELPVSSAEASVATARWIKALSPLIFPYFLLPSIPSFLVSSLPCLSLRALFSKPSTYNLPSQNLFPGNPIQDNSMSFSSKLGATSVWPKHNWCSGDIH